jgi:hypothetical protein
VLETVEDDRPNLEDDPLLREYMLALDQVLRETLVMFDHFWDFDRLVEDGVPRRSEDHGISLILRACGPNKGF